VLASVASLATGLLGATTSSAQAATTGGKISLNGGSTGVETINGDGTGLASLPNISDNGFAPNWAPDGSRLLGGTGPVVSVRTTGASTPVDVPFESNTGYGSPVYWWYGRYIVFSQNGRLQVAPSDGSADPIPLPSASQYPELSCSGYPTASPDGVLAFANSDTCGGQGPDIWTYDGNTGAVKDIIVNGISPAFSADGSKLAFTRVVDGFTQLFTADPDGGNVQQVTTDAVDHSDPSWDPAGGRIAYDESDPSTGTGGVKILDLTSGTTTPLTSAGSKPAWQPLEQNNLNRVYGTGSIGIDDAASRWTFGKTGSTPANGLIAAKSAVLVNKGNATYATPGVSLAAEKQGPLLMTSGTSLDAAASAELKRSLPKGSTVYLVGSTKLLNATVADQVTALGYKVLRMDGADLSTVSARVAKQITAAPSWVFVADGNDYHDPIAAASAAGSLGYRGTGVVLLTRGTTVPSAVLNYLNTLDPAKTKMVSVGTKAREAMENAPLTKEWSFWDVSGSTTELDAANLANFWWTSPTETTVEDTWTWQNAVAGQAVTAGYGPVLWSTESTLSSQTGIYLNQESASLSDVQTFGGNTSYTPAERTAIGNAIAASSAWTTTYWDAAGAPPATEAAQAIRPSATVAPTVDGRPALPTVESGRHFPAPNEHTAR
jgi:hypothetical protein